MERTDLHRADIIAALKKKGISMSKLSRDNGLASTTLANALDRPWPKGERIIAKALGLTPSEVWPSRYAELQQAG
ncbi:helix-turn-helix transcriptional regulator [Shewanella sp. NIFS-20-20]|uniref:helix-turn-helix domain-containing protein n=1 Tax=Shewanella sp. NIFS-20-20 TaxID=2853806 RepID=UPI001C47EDC3|nr:helix-turn-helix transcriptional regulator [Shewanella sp. NIFS-20-20]MBV7315482.1 helix-turn-helix domain-containing protein [Shewanella sp. NIFS-20-20]